MAKTGKPAARALAHAAVTSQRLVVPAGRFPKVFPEVHGFEEIAQVRMKPPIFLQCKDNYSNFMNKAS